MVLYVIIRNKIHIKYLKYNKSTPNHVEIIPGLLYFRNMFPLGLHIRYAVGVVKSV